MPKALEGRKKVATVGRYARASWKRKVKTVDAYFNHGDQSWPAREGCSDKAARWEHIKGVWRLLRPGNGATADLSMGEGFGTNTVICFKRWVVMSILVPRTYTGADLIVRDSL